MTKVKWNVPSSKSTPNWKVAKKRLVLSHFLSKQEKIRLRNGEMRQENLCLYLCLSPFESNIISWLNLVGSILGEFKSHFSG